MTTFTDTQRVFFNAYATPYTRGERSIMRDVPIQHLDYVREMMRTAGLKTRIRYRGPRRDGMRLTTLKRDARRFAVYTR